MGKWSNYRGQENKYLVHPSSHEVTRLKTYLFQDFYLDYNDKKVWIEDLDNVFDNEEEALAFSSKLIAESKATNKEKEEKPQSKVSVIPDHELGVPQGAWAEDAGIYGWDLD